MTVTGGSALGRDEIDQMMKEAESHAEEDKKRREAVEMRNEADALAFRTEKLLKENSDSIPQDVREPVEQAIAALSDALKRSDNDAEVKAAMEDLNQKAAAMGQAVYAAAQAAQASAGGEANADGEPTAAAGGSDEDVIDAEIIDDEPKGK
jgi:molecular chaperone DnaK